MNGLLHKVAKAERVDESFYFDTKTPYHLFLQLDGNYFRAVAYSNTREKYVMQAEFSFEYNNDTLKEIFEKTDFLKRAYTKVRCVVTTPSQTLIPVVEGLSIDPETALGFNVNLAFDQEIFTNALASIDAVMAFAVNKELVSIVSNRFPQVEFIHAAASTISYGIELAAGNSQASMYIVLHEGLLEICLIENNKLKLYNTFAFQTPEDLVYYPLFIAEQFKLSTESLQLYLAGNIARESPAFDIMQKYFAHVQMAPLDKRSKYAVRMEEEQVYPSFLPLFTTRLCE